MWFRGNLDLGSDRVPTCFSLISSPRLAAQVCYIGAESLKPTSATGRCNMVRVAEAMLADFEKLHYKILDKETRQLKIMNNAKEIAFTNWEELLARLPGYFSSRYAKSNLKPEQKSVPFYPQYILFFNLHVFMLSGNGSHQISPNDSQWLSRSGLAAWFFKSSSSTLPRLVIHHILSWDGLAMWITWHHKWLRLLSKSRQQQFS